MLKTCMTLFDACVKMSIKNATMPTDRLFDQLSFSIAATQGCQSAPTLKDNGCVPHTQLIPQLLAPKPFFPHLLSICSHEPLESDQLEKKGRPISQKFVADVMGHILGEHHPPTFPPSHPLTRATLTLACVLFQPSLGQPKPCAP